MNISESTKSIYVPANNFFPVDKNLGEKYDLRTVLSTAGFTNGLEFDHYNPVRRNADSLNDEILLTYYKFSFVRNPWERMGNIFFMSNNHLKFSNDFKFHADERHTRKTQTTFKKFLSTIKDNLTTPNPHSEKLFKPQLELTKINSTSLNFIGKLENLEQDSKCLFENLDLKISIFVENYPENFYSFIYDQESIDMVSEIYNSDIKEFGYDFKKA